MGPSARSEDWGVGHERFSDSERDRRRGAVGRITTTGAVSLYPDPQYGVGDLTPGPDGAVWFTTGADTIGQITTSNSVTIAPSQGSAGTAAAISGAGFASGERVAVHYETGLLSPKSVLLCEATVAADGTFSCAGNLPTGPDSGAPGVHVVKADGKTSHTTARSGVLLTT